MQTKKDKKEVQFCPNCRSLKIRRSHLIPFGDPILTQDYLGWECLDCGYNGKDFFIVDEEDYKRLLKKKFKS